MTDKSSHAREQIVRAQELLQEALASLRDGKASNRCILTGLSMETAKIDIGGALGRLDYAIEVLSEGDA